MTEEQQISFHYTKDLDSDVDYQEGAIIISMRDLSKAYADMHIDLQGTRWHIRPKYEWDQFEEDFETKLREEIDNRVEKEIDNLFLKYVTIEREKFSNGDIQLNIDISSNDYVVDEDGNLVTTSQITDGTENGTIQVGNRAISVGGLRSAAYTESEDYSPMSVSNWADL